MNSTQVIETKNSRSDFFGVMASGLCLVHCMATPLIFVVQACSAGGCAAGPWWWRIVDYLFLVVSIIAIHYSAKATSLQWMPKLLYACWAFLAFIIINEGLQIFPIPHAFIYLPAFGLIALHLYNRRYCQCEKTACCVAE